MIKLTILWNFIAQGWSESWYSNASSLPQKADDPQILAFVQARNGITSAAVDWLGYRISDVSNPRATLIYRNPNPANDTVDPDVPSNAWLFECKGVGGSGTRQLWLRGVPDHSIVWNQKANKFVVQGELLTDMQNFTKLLTPGPWGIRTIKSFKDSAVKDTVQSITNGEIANSTLLRNVQAVGALDKPILVTGFKKPLSYLNGTYQYRSGYFKSTTDPQGLLLLNRPYSTSTGTQYAGGGAVRQPEYGIKLVTEPAPIGPRSRRVGRAFTVPAGRRSAK